MTYPGGPGQPPYSPQNYEKDFWGPVTIRRALEHSRNVPAIKLMDALGPKQVIAYARRFGLTAPLPPYLPIALGAGDETLIEMTSAYSVFPNQGVRMAPYSILKVTDREGNLLEENRPEPQDAIRADTAYVMTSLLRGVVEHGTAVKAMALNWPVAGKTGTTDDFSDAWFIGFDPDITLGVWVGYDQKKPLGQGMSGAEAALPIWVNIFKAYIGDRKDPPKFEAPGNIVFVSIDKTTGAASADGAPAPSPKPSSPARSRVRSASPTQKSTPASRGRLNAASADQADQPEDDRDNKQDVQCAAEGVLGDDAEQPEHNEDSDDGEHDGLQSRIIAALAEGAN